MKLLQSAKHGYCSYKVVLDGIVIGEKRVRDARLNRRRIRDNLPIVMASVFSLPQLTGNCYNITWHRVVPKKKPKDIIGTDGRLLEKFIGFAKIHDVKGRPLDD
jgi:hypothetical protein